MWFFLSLFFLGFGKDSLSMGKIETCTRTLGHLACGFFSLFFFGFGKDSLSMGKIETCSRTLGHFTCGVFFGGAKNSYPHERLELVLELLPTLHVGFSFGKDLSS
jgi:hypothetical protein